MSNTPPWEVRNMTRVPYASSSAIVAQNLRRSASHSPSAGTSPVPYGSRDRFDYQDDRRPSANSRPSDDSQQYRQQRRPSAAPDRSPVPFYPSQNARFGQLDTNHVPEITHTTPTPVDPQDLYQYQRDPRDLLHDQSRSFGREHLSRNTSGSSAGSREMQHQTMHSQGSRSGSISPQRFRQNFAPLQREPDFITDLTRPVPSAAPDYDQYRRRPSEPAVSTERREPIDPDNNANASQPKRGLGKKMKDALGDFFRKKPVDDDTYEKIKTRHWADED